MPLPPALSRVLRIALLIIVGTALGVPVPAGAQPRKPIKIGFLAPLTGGAAQIGRDTVNGFEMYLEEVGHQTAGLAGKLPVIGGAVIVDESILPSFGDEALGYVTPLMHSAALETPANRKFVADYRKKYGKVPSCFAETCYTSARWISEAARQVGGNVYNRDYPPCKAC